jgi:hypothetical protein
MLKWKDARLVFAMETEFLKRILIKKRFSFGSCRDLYAYTSWCRRCPWSWSNALAVFSFAALLQNSVDPLAAHVCVIRGAILVVDSAWCYFSKSWFLCYGIGLVHRGNIIRIWYSVSRSGNNNRLLLEERSESAVVCPDANKKFHAVIRVSSSDIIPSKWRNSANLGKRFHEKSWSCHDGWNFQEMKCCSTLSWTWPRKHDSAEVYTSYAYFWKEIWWSASCVKPK